MTQTLQDETTLRPAETCDALLHGVTLSIRTRRGLPGKLVFLVWVSSCFFEARAYSQTGIGETLSGPDSHETGQGPHGHLLGDWGGERSRLLERGVRFDFQYISDSLWNIKSDRKNDSRVGIGFGEPWTSSWVRWSVNRDCISMRQRSGKVEAISEPILAC